MADRTYPLSRPLFVYTAEEILAEQSHVGVFLSFYLTHVSEEIGAVGYFPASAATISRAQERLRQVREAPARR